MTFSHIVRRTHLYLGMFLLPWFFMYGVSSIPFSHAAWFQKHYDDGVPQWTVIADRPYDISVPENGELRPVAAQILRDLGLEGSYGASRPNPKQLNMYVFDFWTARRVTYFVEQKRLLAETRRFRWDHFLTGMHARGGFEQDSFLSDAWGVLVDVISIGMIVWIATGLYMWWFIRSSRNWGWVAIGGGLLSFAVFLLAL